MTNLLKNKYVNWILLAITVLLVLLRLVHLEADFPQKVTWSGELYTDEGWYSNNAVAYALTGNWYVEGDFNNAINVPILPILEFVSFEIIGISLLSARIVIAICFILMLAILYAVVKKYENHHTALLAIFLLAINYTLFAYSRLAILEIPMTLFVVVSIFLVSNVQIRGGYLYMVLASGALLIAIMTKIMAVFAIPVVILIVWASGGERIGRVYKTGILIAMVVVGYLVYYHLVMQAYPMDFQYYNSNIGSRILDSPVAIAKGVVNALRGGNSIDRILNPLFIICFCIVLFVKELRRKRLIWISGSWIVLNILLLGGYHHYPPRYYIPISVGGSMMVAVVLNYYLTTHRKLWWTMVMMVLIVIYSGLNCYKIARYVFTPEYSFCTMAKSIKNHLDSENSGEKILLGHFANSVGLATGVLSINDKSGTKDLDYKISKYAPNGYVSRGPIVSEIQSVLAKYYDVEFVEKYDVFHNYATGEAVYFYKLKMVVK